MSATSAPFAPPRSRTTTDQSFPKSARLLRPAEFRKVYDNGWRHTCPFFSAFCLRTDEAGPSRFGFTLPRAIGKAVYRNRIKRRFREVVRTERHRFPAGYWIVFNPRRSSQNVPLARLREEVDRLIGRCQS